MRSPRFLVLAIGAYLLANIISILLIYSFVSSDFASELLQSVVSGLSFLFMFIAITRYYISTAPSGFWVKFLLLALVSFMFYAVLALVFGEPLLRGMGFEVSPVPEGSTLSSNEYAILSFFTYGFSSITNGLLALAAAYYLQKYAVRGIYYIFKRATRFKPFFETGSGQSKSRFFEMILWFLLLPFPIQQVLSPNPANVSVLGTGLYLLSALALFLMWGLELASIVGVTKREILRLYGVVRNGLFWFLVFQWLSALVYSSVVAPPILTNWLIPSALLFVRVAFAYGPPALITAYVYKGALEKRAEVEIVEYLKRSDKDLETARVVVETEST